MLFESVIVLRFHVAAADLDGIQFVGADAPQKDFLAAFIGVEKPLSVSLDDRNGQRPIVIANRNGGPFGILRVRTNLGLLSASRTAFGTAARMGPEIVSLVAALPKAKPGGHKRPWPSW